MKLSEKQAMVIVAIIAGVIVAFLSFYTTVKYVCADWKQCSPVPTGDIVVSPTPSVTLSPSLSPFISLTPVAGASATPTPITVNNAPTATPAPGPTPTSAPQIGTAASANNIPQAAPDTGKAQ